MRITQTEKYFSITLVAALVAVLFPTVHIRASPGINKQLSYQAILKTDAGVSVADGDFDMVFRIYTAASGGTQVATSTHTAANGNAVTVTDGIFSVLLGSGTGNALTLDFNEDTLYLGLTVGSDSEMTPRKRIAAAAYAFNADTVDGLDSTSFVRSNATTSIAASSTDTLFTITQSGSGDILNLFDGGIEVFTVLDGGNVGIGTSTPSTALHVIGDITASGGLTFVNATGTGNFQIATLVATGDSSLQGVTFLNATGTGNLQAATLNIISQSTLASASSTNLEASGYLVIGGNLTASGTSALQGATFANATGTTLALTGLTAGSALFAGTGGVISEDSANFFWDDTNNRLGIGTATPSEMLHLFAGNLKLEINAPATSTNADSPKVILVSKGTDGSDVTRKQQWNIFSDHVGNFGTGDLVFQESTDGESFNERMRITETGNVGIGTSTPAGTFHVSNASSSNALVIAASGNVGIGTANPQENLVVGDDLGSFGGIRISVGNSTGDSALNIGEDTNNRAFVFWNSTGNFLNLGTESAGTLYNNTLVVKDGKVGIGDTTPATPLEIVNSNIARIMNTNIEDISASIKMYKTAFKGIASTGGGFGKPYSSAFKRIP